jgi:hypothetical protein
MSDKDVEDKVLAELLLRISTIEKLLLEKGTFTLEEYNVVFNASVNKLMEALKNDVRTTTEITPPGVLKN